MKKPLDIDKLIRIPSVYSSHGYALSPDGQMAAVVWDKPGQYQVFLVPLAGRGRSRQITSGPESKMAPAFSPDGKYLAFAQDYGGDENYDIFIYDLATGSERNLTPDTPDETINPTVSWSPDSMHIAFVSNRQGGFATYTLRVDAGTPDVRRVTHHDYSDMRADWSPDGRYLAVTALARAQETWVSLVPLDGGEAKIVGGPQGPVDAAQARWSPDGKRLGFVSDVPGVNCIFVYDIEAGILTQVTSGPHEALQPGWSPDGGRIAFTWNIDGNVSVGIRELAAGATRYVRVAPGIHQWPQFTHDGRHLAFLYEGPRSPCELWMHSLAGGRQRRLTRSLPAGFTGEEWVAPKVVRWPCDGLTISGLLYRPPRKRGPLPAVLYVHGGPTAQFQNIWNAPVQHLVSQGYVVLAPNYRGSTGYGVEFQKANRFDLGGGDMRDVIAGAEFLVSQGYADPKRLAITGASYGGYLTMTALTRHPQVFAAGSAVIPFLNWFTEVQNERKDLQYWDRQNFGDPVEDAERFRQYSPIFYMQNITAPVQMIAGANDPRCPASETEQAAAILTDMGVPHETIIYPDEGHGFRKVHNRVDATKRRAEFLNKHLGIGRPAAALKQARTRSKPAAKKTTR